MTLSGKVALVTGGGTGIGRAVCHAFARAGARAVGVNYSRSRKEAEATARELAGLDSEGLALRADVGREDEVNAMVSEVVQRFGRLDVLVNNAGVTRWINLPDLDAVTDEAWQSVFRVNVMGSFYCTRAAAPALRAARGAVVNIASTSGHRGTGSSIPYAVSKAALIQLTRVMAAALAPEVRVNSVSPGEVITRWGVAEKGEDWTKASQAQTASRTPLRACATPEHIAEAVMGLIGSGLVTGQDLIVDGGLSITY